jgi:hypothetical protein
MSVRPALAKLNHQDVRQRRRAVRHLFELNDPEALVGFEKLLQDPDPWFREKALEAVEKWAASKDLSLIERLSNSNEDSRRLLAARIAHRAGKAGQQILIRLTSDSEPKIRLASWKARISLDEKSISEALENEDRAVRKAAAERILSLGEWKPEVIIQLLSDDSLAVRNIAIRIIEQRDFVSEEKIIHRLNDLINDSSGELKARIAGILLVSSPNQVNDWIGDSDTAFVNQFSKILRDIDWTLIENLPNKIKEVGSEMLLIRLLRGDRSEIGKKLREELLRDNSRSETMISQLIEDSIGRPIDESTLSIIEKLKDSESELISQSANNLLSEL